MRQRLGFNCILTTIRDGEKAAAALNEEEELVNLARQATAEQNKQRNILAAPCGINGCLPGGCSRGALRSSQALAAELTVLPLGGHETTYSKAVTKAFMAAPGVSYWLGVGLSQLWQCIQQALITRAWCGMLSQAHGVSRRV